MRFAFIDFEFNRVSEANVDTVCASIQVDGGVESHWVYRDARARTDLAHRLLSLCDKGYVFVAYAAAAESRAMADLGLNARHMRFIDLYAEWRQIQYNHDKHLYGRYLSRGKRSHDGSWSRIAVSQVPSINPDDNDPKGDYNQVGVGYADCVAHFLGVEIDTMHKKAMRDLIISRPDHFSAEEQDAITRYCESDIAYLAEILRHVTAEYRDVTGLSEEDTRLIQIQRGRYSTAAGQMEGVGIPVNVLAIRNLSRNYDMACDALITALVTDHYPFYVRQRKTKKDLIGPWVQKAEAFKAYLEKAGLIEGWPLTESGELSTSDEHLSDFDGDPNIKAFRQTKNILGQLKWFRPEAADEILSNIGSDGRMRTWLGPWGTMTGRNAPPAKRFVLAMSSWLRCLIRPVPGMAIIAADYANQEFAIAAYLSGDQAMIAAYESGDPYMWFAIAAGGVPEGGTKAEYPEERKLFKATTLGLQFGMGKVKLARKLTVDCRRNVDEREAGKLIQLHRKVFHVYWRWVERQVQAGYERNNTLILSDGWALMPNCPTVTSANNFPIQGTGGVIMRYAVLSAMDSGVNVVAPLHDALYAICAEADIKTVSDNIIRAMNDGVEKAMPGLGAHIRVDIDVHRHGEPWVEEKGQKHYALLSKYLRRMETKDDVVSRLLGTALSENILENSVNAD